MMNGLSRFFNHDDEANMFIDEIPIEMEDYSSDGENLVEFGKKIKDAFANKKYSKKKRDDMLGALVRGKASKTSDVNSTDFATIAFESSSRAYMDFLVTNRFPAVFTAIGSKKKQTLRTIEDPNYNPREIAATRDGSNKEDPFTALVNGQEFMTMPTTVEKSPQFQRSFKNREISIHLRGNEYLPYPATELANENAFRHFVTENWIDNGRSIDMNPFVDDLVHYLHGGESRQGNELLESAFIMDDKATTMPMAMRDYHDILAIHDESRIPGKIRDAVIDGVTKIAAIPSTMVSAIDVITRTYKVLKDPRYARLQVKYSGPSPSHIFENIIKGYRDNGSVIKESIVNVFLDVQASENIFLDMYTKHGFSVDAAGARAIIDHEMQKPEVSRNVLAIKKARSSLKYHEKSGKS